ncbi:MAG: ankyrin repeat domain-containing protein [Alphaproteobacteria bacterium]|nr:ankyrin repeat domain-containing protein [Alphaproteobacteria bacterium]
MAFYACLRKGFQSGDYHASKEEWLDKYMPERIGEHQFSEELKILDYFIKNNIKVEEGLLGPWVYVFQGMVRLRDKKGILYCLDILKMKQAIKALQAGDKQASFNWLEEETGFKRSEKLKVLALETAKIGSWDILEELFQKGASLNPSFFENKENSLLMTAAKFKHKEMVINLLKKGAKAFFSGIKNEAVFMAYKKENDYEKMADFLLEYASFRLKKDQDEELDFAHYLTNAPRGLPDVFKCLKARPLFSIDAKDENGKSIMEEAILRDNMNMGARACLFGASLSQTVQDGRSLLEWALVHDRDWLLQDFPKSEIIKEGEKFKGGILNKAIDCLASKSAKRLIDNQIGLDDEDEQGRSPLMNALRVNKPEIAEKLLESFVDFEHCDLKGQSVLFYAIRSDNSYYLGRLLEKADRLVNVPDNQGVTPLMQAVLMGNQVMVEKLVHQGADLLRKNDVGEDAFHLAMTQGNTQIANLIKELVKERRGMKSKIHQPKKVKLPKKKVTAWSSISSARQNGI